MPVTRRLADAEFVGPRTARALATLLLIVGGVAAFGGMAYAVNGATQAPGRMTVPVAVVEPVDPADAPRVTMVVDGPGLPEGTWLEASPAGLSLVDWTGNDRWTGFLARGDVALGGLAVGLGALLLAPVLTSVAAGEPFRPGNAARLGGTAATIMVAGVVAPLLPQVAALGVLDRVGLVGSGSPLVAGLVLDLAPVGVGALVFVLAEAFRRGAQIADDTRGLV